MQLENERETIQLNFVHVSLQFSDTVAQMEADTEKIFSRARRRNVTGITGTEAGEDKLWNCVKASAKKYGYRLKRYRSNWIAIDKEAIKNKSWTSGFVFVIDNDRTVGKGHDSAFPWVTFIHSDERVGKINLGAGHYPTQGRTPDEPNYWVNKLYAEKLQAWGEEKAKGTSLVFFGCDFNMPFNKTDPLFGGDFANCWNDTNNFPGTGHGCIDALCRWTKDGRVSTLRARTFNDKQLFLNTDHFPVEVTYLVQALKNVA